MRVEILRSAQKSLAKIDGQERARRHAAERQNGACMIPVIAAAMPLIALPSTAAPAPAPSPFVRSYPDLPEIRDKALVAWVRPANLTQRGGSVLTLERSDSFDAMVLGELKPGAWMAGSEMFHRTQQDQAAYPAETAPHYARATSEARPIA